MLKLQKPNSRSFKSRERVDFKFSNFQALQVPKGWDRLFVFLISAETGKTIAKLGKAALVRNGSCQWTETVSESIWISRDDSSKEFDECPLKFVVSMGSTRSSTLGEATINVAQYTSSRTSVAFSQPLKKCTYGTIFQVKIQCLTPKSKIRDGESKNSSSQEKYLDPDHHNMGRKSDGSDNANDSRDLGTTSHPHKLDSKETSESASGPYNSFDSLESPEGKKILLTYNNSLNSEEFNSNESPVHSESPLNHQSSPNSRLYFGEDSQNETSAYKSSTGSSKNLLEAAEDAIEELRAEAKMWERNARKLMIDLEISRKEFSDMSKKQENLVMELSASYTENDGLKREIEQLKDEMKKSREIPTVGSESLEIRKVMEGEIKYHKNLNGSLDRQLRQSQESNIELVSVLQELEEMIEQQRIEIENLSSLKLEFRELEDSNSRNSEDNSALVLQFQELEKKVRFLEEELREKSEGLENERESNSRFLLNEKEYNKKISVQEEEIESLKQKIRELEKDCTELTDENLELLFKLKEESNIKSDIRKCRSFDSVSSENRTVSPSNESEISNPNFQISHLEEELEKKVREQVKIKSGFENSEEILKQLRIAFHLVMKPWCKVIYSEGYHDFIHENIGTKVSSEYVLSSLLELNQILETRITECEEILRRNEIEIEERNVAIDDAKKKMEEYVLEIQEHEKSKENYEGLVKELDERKSELNLVEANLLSKENENACLLQHQRELEVEISELQKEKIDLENDLTMLRENVDSLVLNNTVLERKLEELERTRNESENEFSGLQEDNLRFRECVEGLEAQVKQLKDEIEEIKVETGVQISDLKKKSEKMEKQWLEAQEMCEYLKAENQILQKSTENLSEDSVKFQNSNSELTRENQELVVQLSKTKKSLSGCEKKVELLEDRLSSVLKDFSLREKSLESEIEALFRENRNQKEKLDVEEIYSENIKELQKEVENLRIQISFAHEERKRIYFEAQGKVKLLENYKKNEDKLKTDVNELELKLTISDYERQQLTEEMDTLKIELQSISDEILALRDELESCRIEKGRLELALETVSEDYEEIKGEKILLTEKVTEFEECQRKKSFLEAKVLEMENELSVKEILSAENIELKNELIELKRESEQYEQKIYRVEGERDECLKKIQELERRLGLMEERYNSHGEGGHKDNFHVESPHAISVEARTKTASNDSSHNNRILRESHIPASQNNHAIRERYERTKSSLETELKDLRERYLEMSLKYAEVETEREDLVMKLKASKSGKRWF